ncbi:MAG TPA: NUDIX domain-containing protein [Nocardia sp.]|uniref:NUDIX domain-containing protein n=1 Tax=Nocardia TaxID=1817 RepID=UPI002458DE92|nr:MULTISPECIES: NUDIX domain-containing protein [Nocardia]HLS79145.1 NUDIX domain-containing protein [Nocardia sp.]
MSDYIAWLRGLVGHAPIQLHCAAAAVIDNGRVLLRRRAGDQGWGLPCGTVELGETVRAAAVRQVAEETGLEVKVNALHGVYSGYEHRFPDGDVAQTITTVLRCGIVGTRAHSLDPRVQEMRFCDLDEELPGPLVDELHADLLADLRAGRVNVLR